MGIKVENAGKQERRILTRGGLFTLRRTALRVVETWDAFIPDLGDRAACCEEIAEEQSRRRGEYFPKDEEMGVGGLPFKISQGLMKEIAEYGIDSKSFEAAGRMLYKHYHIRVSKSEIEKVTYYVGENASLEDREAAEKVESGLAHVDFPDKPAKKGTLRLSADGCAVNTVVRKDGSTWRENKLGEVYSSDNVRTHKSRNPDAEPRHEILKKDYATYLGSAGEFQKRFFECALRNGYGQYEKTVFIADGAPWIWNICNESFPDAVQILDYYHLSDNIWKFARWLYKDNRELYRPWASEMLDMAYNSKTAELIKRLSRYKNKKPPAGVPKIWHYVNANKGRMDYQSYLAHDYGIGSGFMESSNKTVIQQRVDGPGKRWLPENAHRVNSLSARREAGRWNTVKPLRVSHMPAA